MPDSPYSLISYGSKYRVIDNPSGLILRTLNTRPEAITFLEELTEKKSK